MTLPPRTVLIVDDSADDRFFIRRTLNRAGLGFSAHSVAGGEAAVAYLSGGGIYAERLLFPYPSLIITDLQMPLGDGFSVLLHLQKHPPPQFLPVLMFSDSHDPRHMRMAYRLGATFFCIKPQSYAGLFPILSEFFSHPLAHNGPLINPAPPILLPNHNLADLKNDMNHA